MTLWNLLSSPKLKTSARVVNKVDVQDSIQWFTKLTLRTPFSSPKLTHSARVVRKVDVQDSILKP